MKRHPSREARDATKPAYARAVQSWAALLDGERKQPSARKCATPLVFRHPLLLVLLPGRPVPQQHSKAGDGGNRGRGRFRRMPGGPSQNRHTRQTGNVANPSDSSSLADRKVPHLWQKTHSNFFATAGLDSGLRQKTPGPPLRAVNKPMNLLTIRPRKKWIRLTRAVTAGAALMRGPLGRLKPLLRFHRCCGRARKQKSPTNWPGLASVMIGPSAERLNPMREARDLS